MVHSGPVAELEAAVMLSPGNVVAWRQLAEAYAETGNHEVAAAAAAHAVNLDPGSAVAHFNLGFFLGKLGRWPDVQSHYQEAVRLAPFNAAFLCTLGIALTRTDESARAIHALREALRADPDVKDAWRSLGLLLYNERRSADAIPALEKATGRNPKDAESWAALASSYEKTGRHDASCKAFHVSLIVSFQSAIALHDLGVAYDTAEWYEKAEAAFRASLRNDPAFHRSHFGLGRVALRDARPADGLPSLRRAVCMNPKEPEYWEWLDFAHNALGHRRAGLESVRQAPMPSTSITN
jgi:tetratricopeptide (TPR) repeat protein